MIAPLFIFAAMAQYRVKPQIFEAITFDELVEYGKNNGANIVNGMPWSFHYRGCPITHENDSCYLVLTKKGSMRMTPETMLITVPLATGIELHLYNKEIFLSIHDKV